MLVDSFIKLDNPIDIKLFATYQNASFPIRNNVVAFTKIIDQTTTEMNNFISETTKILKLKKNIILQGAPGTGKTYNTAALALSILGVDTTALSHDEIMKEYDKLLEKQIFLQHFINQWTTRILLKESSPKSSIMALELNIMLKTAF